MTELNDKLKEHFRHPQRRGVLENPDGTGIVGNARCGDILSYQIKVEDGRLAQVRFQCLGCGAAKAVASYIAELAEGKAIEEVERLKMEDIFDDLKALPKSKWHCPFQAVDALKMAIEDWKGKAHEGRRKMIDVEPVAKGGRCPYCSEILGENLDWCESCELKQAQCAGCGKKVLLKKGKE